MQLTDTKYDSLIRSCVIEYFPELLTVFGQHGWLYVKAQAFQESTFNPEGLSNVGAAGLMQLMPATDLAIDGDIDGFDPVGNVENGVMYLADQWRHLSEIQHGTDRLKASFASYNGGRGYVNSAMSIGREKEGQPTGYGDWHKAGRHGGMWQTWPVIAAMLQRDDCRSGGKNPDYKQMIDYVEKINVFATQLMEEL